MSGTIIAGGPNGPMAAGAAVTPTPVKTANYTAFPGDFVPVDTSAGAITVTLPAMPADQTAVTVMMINQANGNAVTVATAGGDALNTVAGPTTWLMPMLNQRTTFQYVRALGIWYITMDGVPLTQGQIRGPLTLANLASAPAAPVGGAELYSVGGVLTYVNPQGLVQTIVGSQGGLAAAGSAITGTVAETVLQSMSLPANDAITGAVYKMVGWGVFTSAAAPGNTIFTSRLGGVAGTQLFATANIALTASLTNAMWKHETLINFLTPTTVMAMTEILINTAAGGVATEYLAASAAAVTVSLTSTKAWTLDVTPGAAGNSIQLLGGWTERVA